MENLFQDLRFGARLIIKNPAFSLAAIVVLAFGIGANTAIFSVVDAVLLRPLAFKDPGRLVQVYHVPPPASFPGLTRFAVSPANFLDWQKQNHVFEQMALYGWQQENLTGKGEPKSLTGLRVTSDFFSVLGAQPMLGRTFAPDENQPGRNRVVMLSEKEWRSDFGADPSVVGKPVSLNGAQYTVIGVLPAKFQFPVTSDPDMAPALWTPAALTAQEATVRGNHNYLSIARLRAGVSIAQAEAEMDTISRRLAEQYPADDRGWGATLIPVREDIVGDVRTALLVLLGAVAFVLLIACANVANLVLARTVSRQKEIAIRSALGATQARLLQQVIAETVLLSLTGGIVGVLLASLVVRTIVRSLASQLPRADEITVDGRVLGFALGLSLLSGIVAGLLPAFRLSRANVSDALKQASRTSSDSGGGRTRNALVVSEVALSLMLLIGAGLMLRSLWKLHNVDPGFDPHNVIAVIPALAQTTYPNSQANIEFFDAVLEKARALPGVESAGVIDSLPFSGGSTQPVQIEGRPVQAMADQPEVAVRVITPGYLKTMHIPILRGRDVGDQDTQTSPGAVVISATMAKRFWGDESPIGKHLTLSFYPNRSREIVGIVGDVRSESLKEEPHATLYVPLGQLGEVPNEQFRSFPMWIVVRAQKNASSLIPSVAAAVHQVNPELPIVDSTTLEDFVGATLSQQKLNASLLASFAALALFLAAIGIYSVLAYNVRRRLKEIGIRMALGAQIADVLQMVVSEGMKPTLLGLAIGIAGSLLLGRLLSSLIFGIKATDLATFAAVSLAIVAVGLLASLLPAYRATRVQPVRTLREE